MATNAHARTLSSIYISKLQETSLESAQWFSATEIEKCRKVNFCCRTMYSGRKKSAEWSIWGFYTTSGQANARDNSRLTFGCTSVTFNQRIFQVFTLFSTYFVTQSPKIFPRSVFWSRLEVALNYCSNITQFNSISHFELLTLHDKLFLLVNWKIFPHFETKQQKKMACNEVSRAVYLFGIKLNGQIVKMWMWKQKSIEQASNDVIRRRHK